MASSSIRILNRPIVNILNDHLIDYPTPININYLWNFGSLAGIFLGIQIVSGIFLAMHYTPHVDLAFLSVEHIMRDVSNNKSLLCFSYCRRAYCSLVVGWVFC